MQNKHREKKDLMKEIAYISVQLKSILRLFLYSVLIKVMKRNFKSFGLHRKGKTMFQDQFC